MIPCVTGIVIFKFSQQTNGFHNRLKNYMLENHNNKKKTNLQIKIQFPYKFCSNVHFLFERIKFEIRRYLEVKVCAIKATIQVATFNVNLEIIVKKNGHV